MTISYEKLHNIIKEAFPEAKISLVDTAGDENHYDVTIISEKFSKKTLIQQHRMVYDALQDCMGNELHALKINTKCKND